jgi:myo-inositol-1(or 4)-monophosphatase
MNSSIPFTFQNVVSSLASHSYLSVIELGFRIVTIAGNEAQKKHSQLSIQQKGEIDLVTNIDIETEKFLLSEIQRNFPDHSTISEECEDNRTSSSYTWIIDPIDGTTNFAHYLPLWAVSIAFYKDQKPIAGWVYAPEMNQLFFGLTGLGSWLNGSSIHVSSQKDLLQSLLSTGFPYDIRHTPYTNLDLYAHFCKCSQAVRRFGSASLDICYTGCGMLDGYWEQMLQLWDFAAARIILEEAGGFITDIHDHPIQFQPSSVICSNSHIHTRLVKEIHSCGARIRSIT